MKFIYLDEWCWIDINNAIHGKQKKKGYSKFITLAINNINKDIWAFPLSLWHLEETRNTGNTNRRITLAQIQQKFSNDWFIRSFHHIRQDEMLCALQGKSLKQNEVIQQDLSNMFGTTHKQLVDDILFHEGVSDLQIQNHISSLFPHSLQSFTSLAQDYEPLDTVKKHGIGHLKSLKALDEQRPLTEYEALIINFKDYYKKQQQELILKKLLSQISDLSKNDARKKLVDFFKDFPSFYTGSMLLYEDIKSKSNNSFHKNDFLDITFLSVAIPYCDVVVTESHWKRQAEKQHLGKLYNTLILDNIKDIK